MTITINTRKSAAIYEWQRKESGSYEDNHRDASHPYAILDRWGGNVTMTETEAKALLQSGSYHSTAWDYEDITGGHHTKQVIARYCDKIRLALNKATAK
jgi:hypothetical protein